MRKSWFYLGAISSLVMLLSACGDSQPAATPSPSPSAAATPAATPAATAPTPAPTTTAAATTPAPATTPAVDPKTATPPGTKPASADTTGLIPPTNGENWAKTVAKGRTDPFATLALQPIEVFEKNPLNPSVRSQPGTGKIATKTLPAIKSGVNSALPKIKISTVTSKTPIIASKGETTAEPSIARYGDTSISSIPKTGINRKLPKITVAIKPSNAPNSSITPRVASNTKITPSNTKITPINTTITPIKTKVANNNVLRPVDMGSNSAPTPRPTEVATRSPQGAEQVLQAKAVEVSGVIEVEGKTQVIVKLPNESFSRYINVGDRIANSNIIVKRIEDRGTISPTIVLSEGGTEVSHKIGEKPASQTPAK